MLKKKVTRVKGQGESIQIQKKVLEDNIQYNIYFSDYEYECYITDN